MDWIFNLRKFLALAFCVVFVIASCSTSNGGGPGPGTAGTAGTAGTGAGCPDGRFPCNGGCVDYATDRLHCGGCNLPCSGTQNCVARTCSDCTMGQAFCSNSCVDTNTNPSHCGGCSIQCGTAQMCVSGDCTCPNAATPTACGQQCVNTQTDSMHCGGCNAACPSGSTCAGGMCTCPAPTTMCPGLGCFNLQTSGAHCGNCATACTGQVCSNGTCSDSCASGQPPCSDNSCPDFMTDRAHCGGCGMACVGTQACNGGSCACGAGQLSCGGTCVDSNSNSNCGSCGNICMNGATCQGGMCMGGMGTGGAGGGAGTGGAGGAGGASGGAGGAATGGAGGVTGRDCPVTAGLISDFEEGSGLLVQHEGRNGWWYTFADTQAGSITPMSVEDGPVAVEMTPNPPGPMTCAQYSMHSVSSGHTQYVGFGGTFLPGAPGTDNKSPHDVSAHTGMSFRIRSNSGNAPPILFEVLNRETQPAPAGTATNDTVDTYNTRSKLLTGINATWQEIFVPFGILAPRYLPDGLASSCMGGVFCEAPAFNPASALGFQFSLYDQFMAQGANGSYDLWVDDVKFYTGDQGFGTLTQTGSQTFPRNAAVGSCAKPAGADGKQIINAFQAWKSTFVETCASGGMRVKRPENSNDSVSEGIAYGMLIAVYMNDKPLFDGLWAYWQRFVAASGPLMHWQISGCDGVAGMGSATDADEDAAFALLMAEKQWGGYSSAAMGLINAIWDNDVEGTTINGGSSFPGVINLSYFAPAYYRAFDAVDSNGAHNWAGVISTMYGHLASSNSQVVGSTGLVPAWCSNNCTTRGGGPSGPANPDKYQYDSHRTPWRVGLDACWNNVQQAKDYVLLTSNFFAGKSTSGIGTILDIYEGNGTNGPDPKANSMSIVGTAAVGAMASAGGNPGHQRFLDAGYRFILDAYYTADPSVRDVNSDTSAFTYYNATVGLLAAITMSGNFNLFP